MTGQWLERPRGGGRWSTKWSFRVGLEITNNTQYEATTAAERVAWRGAAYPHFVDEGLIVIEGSTT